MNLTLPEASSSTRSVAGIDFPPAVVLRFSTLTQRVDFQRASRAAHVALPGFVVQMRRRSNEDPLDAAAIRVGYTCSKKVGNAVARNRAKRRLREIARLTLPAHAQKNCDYVLIGRRLATAGLPFTTLQSDFIKALGILHGKKK